MNRVRKFACLRAGAAWFPVRGYSCPGRRAVKKKHAIFRFFPFSIAWDRCKLRSFVVPHKFAPGGMGAWLYIKNAAALKIALAE